MTTSGASAINAKWLVSQESGAKIFSLVTLSVGVDSHSDKAGFIGFLELKVCQSKKPSVPNSLKKESLNHTYGAIQGLRSVVCQLEIF
jgi:hypothetical protein